MMGHKDKQGTFNVRVTLHSDMEVLLLTTQTPPAFHEHWDTVRMGHFSSQTLEYKESELTAPQVSTLILAELTNQIRVHAADLPVSMDNKPNERLFRP